MSEVKCPNCGRELPSELGQHALTPVSGLVTCPHCGEQVHLPGSAASGASEEQAGAPGPGSEGAERPSGTVAGNGGQRESFAGNESIADLKDELKDKQPDD
jgi:endogenous inhibitor of DNA gyrase (YacG/DUF329 family)